MKTLLDIDDTALISADKGKTWEEHFRLKDLIKEHSVYLYSGNPDIENYATLWKVKGYFPKGNDYITEGDVLIDNDADLWKDFVEVKYHFYSIDEFLKNNSKLKIKSVSK